MNISFDKIDSFTGIIEEVKKTLQCDKYIMAIYMMNSKPEMRAQFININNSNKSEECKHTDRIMYLIDLWKLTDESAKRQGYNNVQALAEFRLKQMFNKKFFLEELLNVYYKVAACNHDYKLKTDNDVNKFIRDAEIYIGTKINKSDVVNVIQKGIPQIKDIEAEFWSNCSTLDDVDKMRSFYYNRLSGHIDTNIINWFGQRANDKHPNLDDLVLCGLLDRNSMGIIQACFIMLAAIARSLCDDIIDFLNKCSITKQCTPPPQTQCSNDGYNENWTETNFIDCIYNQCNNEQWESITKEQFIDLLNNGGKHTSLNIKGGETNRTKYVFRIIANNIKDKDRRKKWIDDIKKNIFDDVDFMKATLRIDKLSSGYSSKDIELGNILDCL